jgi:hypothetical protein
LIRFAPELTAHCDAPAPAPGLFLFGSGTSSQFAVQLAAARAYGVCDGNKYARRDLVWQDHSNLARWTRRENAMENRIKSDFEQLDHKTCQSICDAVGERLQQDIRPESWLSPDLEHLVNELRRQDDRPDLRAI